MSLTASFDTAPLQACYFAGSPAPTRTCEYPIIANAVARQELGDESDCFEIRHSCFRDLVTPDRDGGAVELYF
jgi:hypothetical protein